MGGGALLDNCILSIQESPGGKFLYNGAWKKQGIAQ
jgi:hypothetical protein